MPQTIVNEMNKESALRWYQSKRLPLWVAVGATFGFAAWTLSHRAAADPGVQTSKDVRMDGLPEERPGYAAESQEGLPNAPSKRISKGTLGYEGLKDGEPQGIFPNKKIANKMSEMVHDPPKPVQKIKDAMSSD